MPDPNRIKATEVVLSPGDSLTFPGVDRGQKRSQLIVTNESTSDAVWLLRRGVKLMPIPAGTDAAHPGIVQLDSSDDLQLKLLPTAGGSAAVTVCEIFPPNEADVYAPNLTSGDHAPAVGNLDTLTTLPPPRSTVAGGSYAGARLRPNLIPQPQ